MKTRREFIKDTCTTCMGAAFFGITFSQLTSCSPLPIYKTSLRDKSVSVPVTYFAESNVVIVRDLQMTYDILLVKKSEQEYISLYMKCSHEENPVVATRTGLFCPTHGSTFNLDGAVTKEPARTSLQKFKTEIDNQTIIIYINS